MCETPGLLALLPELFHRKPIRIFTLNSSQRPAVGLNNDAPGSSTSDGSSSTSSAAQSGLAAPGTVIHVGPTSGSGGGDSAAAAARSVGVDEQVDDALAEVVDEDLERAHAQLAWLVASLASDIKSRWVAAAAAAAAGKCRWKLLHEM
jgi:hypothetical protein